MEGGAVPGGGPLPVPYLQVMYTLVPGDVQYLALQLLPSLSSIQGKSGHFCHHSSHSTTQVGTEGLCGGSEVCRRCVVILNGVQAMCSVQVM